MWRTEWFESCAACKTRCKDQHISINNNNSTSNTKAYRSESWTSAAFDELFYMTVLMLPSPMGVAKGLSMSKMPKRIVQRRLGV